MNTFASVALAFTASIAHAQPFIEFHIQAVVDSQFEVLPEEFKIVFDASEPTTPLSLGRYSLQAVYVDNQQSSSNVSDSPMIAGDQTESVFASGALFYRPSTDQLEIYADDSSVTIRSVLGDFSDIASSIPDDPAAFLVDTTDPDAKMTYSNYFNEGLEWTLQDGFTERSSFENSTGAFSVRVRVVEDPNAPEPCDADLNKDGVLDFFDVSAYIDLYSNGCP